MNDGALLLRRYAEEKSEAAFAEVVHRHLDLVYSAALRRLGGDAHRAADVAQQVFTTLARDAKKLSRHDVLTAWLYTATRNAAIDLIRSEQRRHAREQAASTMQNLFPPEPHADWEKLRPVLDGVMDELPDADRTAVLLRFFEQRSFAEIGAALNLSEDAARMRVDRALEKLHQLLSRRGVTSTAGALAAVLANQAVATAPVGLAASITGAALTGAAVVEAGTVAAVIAFMSATKTTAVLGVAAALTIASAIYQSNQARAASVALDATRHDHAAARARLAELDAKAQAAEQALAEREKAIASLAAAAPTPPPTASVSADEAAKQQQALQQYLESNPAYRAGAMDYLKVWWMAYQGPLWKSIGLTPEQVERAAENTVQNEVAAKERRAAGLDPANPYPPWSKFRTLFGDAATERMIEASKNRWKEGRVLRSLSGALYYTEEPFTPQQTKRMTDILGSAMKTSDDKTYWVRRCDWDQVLAKAEPGLSPVQMQGLRAVAAQARMMELYDAANKEAAAAGKK